MSATVTLTMAQRGVVSACPNCGIGLPEQSAIAFDAQQQIEDLQAQVRLLTQKATNAGRLPLLARPSPDPALPCPVLSCPVLPPSRPFVQSGSS